MKMRLLMLTSFGLLYACGGGVNTDPNPDPEPNPEPVNTDYSNLTLAKLEAKSLKPASATELEQRIKNGIRLTYGNYAFSDDGINTVDAPTTDSAAPGASDDGGESSGSNSGNFSDTNTHVDGVDEADVVKYDGDILYVASPAHNVNFRPDESQTVGAIKLYATDPSVPDTTEVGRIEIVNPASDNSWGWGNISEMYLAGNSGEKSLATLRSSYGFYPMIGGPTIDLPAITDFASSYFEPWDQKTQVALYDVNDPAQPAESWRLRIDGNLYTSRKIGDTLYLVTNFSSFFRGIKTDATTTSERVSNEVKIRDTSLEKLLPKYQINDGPEQTLVRPEDCLVPVDADDRYGINNMVSIIAIDLADPQISSVKCLNANIAGVYASQQSLYLGASEYNLAEFPQGITVVHKFLFDDTIQYRATGVVPGSLGWGDAAFRMDEHDGHFRIVTSDRSDGANPVHMLTVLKDNPTSDTMDTVATLPNASQPAPIGKPNEEIYGVRFYGERAFVVTFQRVDPLYVIDLSNPAQPSLAGELEVPGFSNYLHLVGEDYLLGIGNAATDEGLIQGMKASLYDVSDMTAPREVNSVTIGTRGTYSSASNDLRALSFLGGEDSDSLRFTMPVHVTDAEYRWQKTSLHLFEIDGISGSNARLTLTGDIIAESREGTRGYPIYYGTERGIIHDDAVFYIHGSGVWSAFWQTPDIVNGPEPMETTCDDNSFDTMLVQVECPIEE